MNFAQWLFLEENSVSNKFRSIEDRVRSGKAVEYKILQAMTREHQWQIQPATERQDKFSKIDGILTSTAEQIPTALPAPIQIKYRDQDSGDDILMEVVWEFSGNYDVPLNQLLTGRDMRGSSKLYLCLNRTGNIVRARLADEAKNIAIQLLEGLISTRKRVFSIGKSIIRITEDPKDKRQKINAYIDPNHPSFSWKRDYPVSDVRSAELIQDAPLKQTPDRILPKDVPPSVIPAMAQALETGSATINLSNNARKVKAIQQYVGRRGLDFSIEDGKIVLRKAV